MSVVIDPVVPTESVPATRPVGKVPLARLVYWSIRRELWESRVTLGAPVVVAILLAIAFALGATNVASLTVNLPNFSFDSARDLALPLLTISAAIVFAVAFIVSFTYASEALYGERRDRTILFWKSLPVSDAVTVVSKVLVPLVVLPIFAWLTIVVLQVVLLVIWAIVLQVHGSGLVWSAGSVVHIWGLTLYGVLAAALWYVPVYGWLLLVSAWVPRSPFFLASLAVGIVPLVERIVFGSRVVGDYLSWRLFHSHFGNPIIGVDGEPVANVAAFFASPHLWTGIVFGVVCLYAAIVLRRSRQPL